MHGDTRYDRFLIWVARRVPHGRAQRIHWYVQDRRLDRAMANRERAAEALRRPRSHRRRRFGG